MLKLPLSNEKSMEFLKNSYSKLNSKPGMN